ncbi:hypothetical protein [Thermococcus sp.]
MEVDIKDVVILMSLVLILSGLPNTIAGSSLLEGEVLHVWSHDFSSSYTEIHVVNRELDSNDVFAVEQTVLAANYSGSAGVALLEVQVTDGGKTAWYSFYWYGEDRVYINGPELSIIVTLDMSVPHTYRIEVTKERVGFYVDGSNKMTIGIRDITKIQQVNTGRWDTESVYDLYIDNIKEYWNGELIASEDFDDGKDNFYTDDHFGGNGDSGEAIISSKSVPEFPFLEQIIDRLANVIDN